MRQDGGAGEISGEQKDFFFFLLAYRLSKGKETSNLWEKAPLFYSCVLSWVSGSWFYLIFLPKRGAALVSRQRQRSMANGFQVECQGH